MLSPVILSMSNLLAALVAVLIINIIYNMLPNKHVRLFGLALLCAADITLWMIWLVTF